MTSADNIDSTVNDFDNFYPWSDIRTCSLNKDGSVKKYYNEPDFSWTDDYIMTEVPEFWWNREQKVEDDATYEYIYISRNQTDKTLNKSEKFYIGRYTATGSSSNITCKSNVTNLTNISITDLRNATKKIGTNWGLVDILRWSIIQMLYLVEYADYDCQKMLGNGVCNGSKINSGGCDTLLMKSGCLANDRKSAVIYRGIENLWGNISQWLDGINIDSYYASVCYDRSQYASNKVASPYKKLAYEDATSNGYIKTMGYDADNSAIQRATATEDTDGTYCPDYFDSDSSTRAVYVGGSYNHGGYCGLWFADYGTSSNAYSYLGGRLLYIPEN